MPWARNDATTRSRPDRRSGPGWCRRRPPGGAALEGDVLRASRRRGAVLLEGWPGSRARVLGGRPRPAARALAATAAQEADGVGHHLHLVAVLAGLLVLPLVGL